MDTRLIPECYADTALTIVLGYPKTNHQFGNGNVLNALRKSYKTNLGIGLLDKDKNPPKDIGLLYPIIDKIGSMEVRQMPDTRKFLILHPNFENWTWEEGQKKNIYFSEKADRNFYKSVCKDMNAHKNDKLKNYLNALKQADTEIRQLHLKINSLIQTNQ